MKCGVAPVPVAMEVPLMLIGRCWARFKGSRARAFALNSFWMRDKIAEVLTLLDSLIVEFGVPIDIS